MSQSTINTEKKKNKSTIAFDIALIVSIVVYIVADFYNKIFPMKYSLIALALVIILGAIGLFVKNRLVKALMTLLILLMAFGQYYTMNGLDRVFKKNAAEQHSYSIVVTKDSGYEKLNDINQKEIIKTDSFLPKLLEDFNAKIKDKVTVSRFVSAKDDVAAAKLLLADKTKVLLFDEAMRNSVEDSIEDFSNKTRIIETFSVTMDSTASGDPVLPSTSQDDIEKLDPSNPQNKDLLGENEQMLTGPRDSFTILISGIDVKGPVSTVSRSDVNILMTINPKTKNILTVSIPRDSFIPISCFDNNKDKLTHAGIRGTRCTQTTLANYFGITIDYFIKVNFTSVVNILNVVGNIDVYSHHTFVGHLGTHFTKGMNNLNSKQALEFARTRKTVSGGDFTRGIHQQEIIKGTFNKLVDPSNIFRTEGIINSISSSISTNVPSSLISSLISQQLDGGGQWNFKTYAVTGSTGMRPTYLYPHQNLSIVYISGQSRARVRAMINALR